MHRIVSARSIYQNSFHNVVLPSRHSFTNSSLLDIKCSFCQKILSERHGTDFLLHTRHQSTKTASALKSQKKKKHKAYKKYGELLEVSEKAMTETKVSISRFGAAHLSKLASSSVSLGQLHQLTHKSTKNKIDEVDPELLETVKEKILKKGPSQSNNSTVLQDDSCALVYSNKVLHVNDWFNTKQCMESVKESYYNFQKATLYDQRLQDLRYAINEGIKQEFNFNQPPSTANSQSNDVPTPLRTPHSVFKELFVENQMDSYDVELLNHMSQLPSSSIAHPAIDDLIDDPAIQNELAEEYQDLDLLDDQKLAELKSLKIVKAKALKEKKKAIRNKKKAKQELSMKEKIEDIDLRGKRDSLHRLLLAHMQLLCTLNMVHEARKILQYYRHRAAKVPCFSNLTDVGIYNTLLHGYASMGNLDNTKELFQFMKQDKVEPNPQTFAAIFECIENSNINHKDTVLNEYLNVMNEKGITCNDLLDKSKFLNKQRESVLGAIHRIDPSFQPQYTPPELDHNCDLLEKLNLDRTENRKGLNKSPAAGVMSLEELKEKAKLQFETEIKGDIVIENIAVKDAESDTVKFYRQKLEETETEWRGVIKEAFIRNVGTLKSQSNASHTAITLYPYLKVLSVDQFVELLMAELSKLVDGSETYSPTLKLLQRDLGTMVYHKYQVEQYRRNGVLDKMCRVYDQYCEWYLDRKIDGVDTNYNVRQAWQVILARNMDGPSLDFEEAPWPIEMRQNIGKFLYNIIINDVKIDINMFKPKAKVKKLPAVYKVHRPWGRMVRLELKPHPSLARLWALAARPALRMRAALCAAAAPPRAWLPPAPCAGGYLLTAVPLVRMPMFVSSQWNRLEEAPPTQLYPSLDSLNQLGEVPWTINKSILDLQMHVFRNGGNKKLDIPPPSSSLDTSQFGDKADAASAFKRRIAINRARAEMHSLWCDSLYKLSLANHYRDSVFWLPHNMDFRGRVYACPPHISQLGADASRALLMFAKKEPLGPNGLRWLKLHAVNLTGTMKRFTVEERLEYAESILDKILDSADHPLAGAGWWTKSEEPWQTLACCKEIANAVRSPNPEEYLSGFPVHQDGSCNGLQHYAALGGDAGGARAVNLLPTPRPQDVYTAVAELVEEMRKRDAAAGNPQAIILENFVRRKVIKQTVMTTVYGVTRFGARLQIAKQLKDIDDFPKDQVWACSQYLTTKTFDSLREMFASTKQIQDWFTDCAKIISSVCGESVEWTSELGLPIVQPYYRRPGPQQNNGARQATRPCTMKQRNAFPPNFIHSLDSCHMMLTGLHCQAEGITFVSVHDCFWTHACTVDAMNKICREQFVALHSQPILEDLSKFMVKRYSYDESELAEKNLGASNKKRVNDLLKRVPSKGDFDITSVLDSVYFFS